MRIESIVIPTSAPADLQAVSIACKPRKQLLEQYEAYHEELKTLLLRAADAISEGYELRIWRPEMPVGIFGLQEQNLIWELRKAAEPSI